MPASAALTADAALQVLGAAEKRGYAACVILKVEGRKDVYAWQRKTPGYPSECMVGALQLFGGNAEDGDANARETLVRELHEEFPTQVAASIVSTLKPFARYVVESPLEAMAPRPYTHNFTACVFSATLPSEAIGGEVYEGTLETMTLAELTASSDDEPRFCWAYHVPFAHFLEDKAGALAQPISARRACHCTATRVAANADIGSWESGEMWQ